MVVQVFMLGDKLLDRLRSTTFAMLGLVTAVGLVLVALVLQQGWPSVFGGPLPGFPNKPPADEIASAVPGGPGGSAAPASPFGAGVALPGAGSVSGGSGFDDSRNQGSHQVAASAPVKSGSGPAPSETAPEPPTAPPAADTSPPPAPPAATAPPPAPAAPATSAKESGGNDGKTASGAESKKTRGKDKVAANGKGSPSKGSTTPATAKPKPSGSKPKPSAAKPSSPPADKASAEPAPVKPAPPASEPANETETLPVEEKGESGSGHGDGKDK